MKVFSITQAQLDEFANLNLEYVADVERMKELVKEIKKQVLVPVEQVREAFERTYGKTQDALQRGLLAQAQTELPAAE